MLHQNNPPPFKWLNKYYLKNKLNATKKGEEILSNLHKKKCFNYIYQK